MSNINNLRSVRISNILGLMTVAATLSPKDLEAMAPQTLDSLEKSLTDAARNVNSPIPPVERQREMVKSIDAANAKKKKAKQEVAPVGAIAVELSLTRVGDKLHLRTPFWNPLNYKCREVFGKETTFDRDLGVRVFPLDREDEVLATVRESFGEASKPHHLMYDGKRIIITAGKSA